MAITSPASAEPKTVTLTIDGREERVAEWSPGDDASIDAARELLQRELDAGCIAVRGEDDDNEPLTELPVDAEAVILTMPMGGG